MTMGQVTITVVNTKGSPVGGASVKVSWQNATFGTPVWGDSNGFTDASGVYQFNKEFDIFPQNGLIVVTKGASYAQGALDYWNSDASKTVTLAYDPSAVTGTTLARISNWIQNSFWTLVVIAVIAVVILGAMNGFPMRRLAGEALERVKRKIK